MKNKIELKKAIISSIIAIFIFVITFGIFQYYQYNIYIKNTNNRVGTIINEVLDKYPDTDKNKLIEIINSKDNFDEDFFRIYGIDLKRDSLIYENDYCFKMFTISNLIFLCIFAICIISIFLKYNKSKDKKLKEITNYIEEINNKNYRLDIDDNTEDELSILKNEIYKTTVMLKEIAENSMNDKIYLKDSLSDISHQLKTPLTSISIMLDNILENPNMDNTTRIEFEKDIRHEIINIRFLVNSLLKLSKLDANSVDFINKQIKIKEVIEEAIKNVSVLCDLKNMEINITGDIEGSINCDLRWQVEALTNIIKNGIEHSNNNSKIDIYCEENEIYSKIEIKDYGMRNR